MKGTSHTPKLNGLRRFMLTASVIRLSAVASMFVAIFAGGGAAIANIVSHETSLLKALLVWLLAGLISGALLFLFYIPLFRWQRRDFDRRIGIETTGQDRIALETWFRYGVKPTATHLQPALENYITYMERTTSGTLLPFGRKYNYVMVIFALLLIGLDIWSYVDGDISLIRFILHAILFGFLAFSWWPSRKGKPNLFFRLAGRRSLEKIRRMRQQINKA